MALNIKILKLINNIYYGFSNILKFYIDKVNHIKIR